MIGVCKFCKCTQDRPCLIPSEYVSDPELRPVGNVFPCDWLLEDVCTNPECVKKAYEEACIQLENLIFSEAA
jgi:hypothetical protein